MNYKKSTIINNLKNYVKEQSIIHNKATKMGAGIVPVAIFNGSLFFLFWKGLPKHQSLAYYCKIRNFDKPYEIKQVFCILGKHSKTPF